MKKPFYKKIIPFIKARFAPRGSRITFSTCAEDLIMSDILGELNILKPSYIDIGAHHPIFGNNTYLFYKHKGRGVLVEPNPSLCDVIRRKRPDDICVNGGIGRVDGNETFFTFERSTRSTFSADQAKEWQKVSGQRPIKKIVQIFSLDSIIDKYFKHSCPDVVSIDAEGYDIEILSGFSFKKRPKIFCIESVFFGRESPKKNDELIFELMKNHGYVLELQTRNNSIFVDSEIK